MVPFHQKCLSLWLMALCFSFLFGKADELEDSSAKKIESVVRKYCGKQKGKLTQEDVSKITQIHLWDMNLKKDYIAKVIGKETIISDGTPFKCWEISQNGVGIGEQLFWVTENGILQRILMDGRKQIDLQTVDSND